MNLEKIGGIYGTDKVSHGFCEIYDNKFSNIKDSAENILEIGVFFGASILMWKDYFKNSKIHGVDTFKGLQGNGHVFKDADKFYIEWESNENLKNRISLYKYDQSKESDLKKFISDVKKIEFDIIIDDASHLMRDQQITFKHLFPLLKSGGIYVIEDLHSSIGGYDVNPDFSNTTLGMIKTYLENGNLKSVYTDMDSIKDLISNVEVITVERNGSITSFIEKK